MVDNFKKASKKRLRFQTNVGLLTIEQLWDLNLTSLDYLAVSLEKEYKESGSKSFLTDTKESKDKDLKLRFDIVLEILQDRQKAEETARKAQETKERNQKILTLISEKQDDELKGKSIEELEAMLK